MCRIERTRERAGTISHEIAYAITRPRAVAALRNTMLAIVNDSADPLAEIREIFAETRLKAIATAQQGFL